jgi:hypothetical protein
MKTFKQFQEQLSLSQAFSRVGKPGGGVGDWERSATIRSLAARSRSPGGNSAVPLPQATYQGRADAGRNTPDQQRRGYADNPDYVGQVGPAPGIRDRMPGTTPSSSPYLLKPIYNNKSTGKPDRYRNFI